MAFDQKEAVQIVSPSVHQGANFVDAARNNFLTYLLFHIIRLVQNSSCTNKSHALGCAKAHRQFKRGTHLGA